MRHLSDDPPRGVRRDPQARGEALLTCGFAEPGTALDLFPAIHRVERPLRPESGLTCGSTGEAAFVPARHEGIVIERPSCRRRSVRRRPLWAITK
jgi:hypothetical protein